LVFRPQPERKTKHLLGFQVTDSDLKPQQILALLNKAMILNVKPSVSRSKSLSKSATPKFS
jgi:hypothetical protein